MIQTKTFWLEEAERLIESALVQIERAWEGCDGTQRVKLADATSLLERAGRLSDSYWIGDFWKTSEARGKWVWYLAHYLA